MLLAGVGFGAGWAAHVGLGKYLRRLHEENPVVQGPSRPDTGPPSDRCYSIKAYSPRFIVERGDPIPISFGAMEPNGPPAGSSGCEIIDGLSGRQIYSDRVGRQLTPPASASYKDGFFWSDNLVLDGASFPAGFYQGYLLDEAGKRSDPFHFAVRDKGPRVDRPLVGLVFPTYTWQAYNSVGGGSFYTTALPDPKIVSLKRPLWSEDLPGIPTDAMTIHSAVAASAFPQFLHDKGVDFVPVTSEDLHTWPAWMKQLRLLVFLVHDEYWSMPMRRQVHEYLVAGGQAAVFAGNICWMKVNVGPDAIRCRRWSFEAPGAVDPTGLWYRGPINWPEEATFGQSFRFGGFPLASLFDEKSAQSALQIDPDVYRASGGIIIREPEHPLFAGTGLKSGDNFGSDFPLLMTELDGLPLTAEGLIDRERSPAIPKDVNVLATGLGFYRDYWGENAYLNRAAVVTESRIGAGRVMHFGSFGWFRGLARKDPRAQTIVTNALRTAGINV